MERDTTWLLAYCYPDMQTAGEAFERARDIVFSEDIDASAYRVQLNGVPHVVVLGEAPLLPELRRRFEVACAGGEPVELPTDARAVLVRRRLEGRIRGAFWERRPL
jgi:hypothetical protein